MKILYVSNHRFPTEKAHGLQIAKMCEAFMNQGVAVKLIIPMRKQPSDLGSAKEFYGLKEDIQVEKIWNVDFLLSRIFPKNLAYWIQSFSFVLSFMGRRFRYRDYVLYSRTFLPMIGYRGRWFFEAHTFPLTRTGQIIQKVFLKKAQGLICISEALARKYGGIYKGEIMVAHDGVDLKLFQNLKKKNNEKVVLYTGSPYEEKGVLTLAKACESLKDISCVFVGGNKDDPSFKLLKKMAKSSKVIPYVKHTEVPDYIAKADCLVIPNSAKNKTFSEDTSPLKLFEYMASGKKIVASDVIALRAVLTDEMAWFFKADDEKDLSKKIVDALNSNDGKGSNASKEARKYSWEARAKQIISFLAHV